MYIRIKRTNKQNEEPRTIWFPSDEETLYEICNELGIEMTTEPNCYIENSMDMNFIRILQDKNCNIDELNYLMKRLDGFGPKEIEKFYAASFAENPKIMAELINLSFNIHCYSLITDFNNLESVGKNLYLTERQAVVPKELDELDGESYAMEVIGNNLNSTITPYGVLYKNSNEPEQVYNGKQFPPYEWKDTMAIVELKAKGESEFIYIPCSDIEITKALMRLETSYLHDCEVAIDSCNIPDEILNIIPDDLTPLNKIDTLNNLADKLKEMRSDIHYFERLMAYVNPKTINEIFSLAESMYEFELFDGIKDAESYGRYMICESGHFEYDDNLEEYIDFKRYGQVKMANEVGAFSSNGYIVYHGYNQKLSNILSKNLGMEISKANEQKILKLYMPLNITTYDIENEYGYHETSNEPIELSNYEVTDYLDEILESIEKDNLSEEKERGLMRYYDDHDSVNAKISKYEFNPELAMEYLEIRISKEGLKNHSTNFIKRAILILDHYNKYGKIPLRCYTPITKLTNPQYIEILNSYGKHLLEGEYSSRTIEGYLSNIVGFMRFLEDNEYLRMDMWSAEIMFKYIETLAEFKKATIKHNTGSVRLFLRYLYLEGFTNEDLSKYIGSVRGTYHQKLPSFWTKNEVEQLLNVIDQNNPNEKRDYTMILLVARLGLRSSDVKKLKFENLHWKENQIVIVQSKTGEPLTLPLLRDVGWAIIDYVQNARPNVDNPHVFLKHLPPYTELSERNHLYKTIEKYMIRAKLPISAKKRDGMHSLRHSLATTLMEENISLSDISGILSHASLDSTSVYLSVDINRLRHCALEVNN